MVIWMEVVKYLVEHGADKESKDQNGKTSLLWTAVGGYLDMLKYLVEHGANRMAADREGG